MLSKEIRRAALFLLARRDHTSFELARKLRLKKFPDTDIQHLVSQLTEEGFLSNERFVENYIHYRYNKGYGPLRIQEELRERGIPEELIEPHLKIADNAWQTKARDVWRKRFKGKLPEDFKTRAQQMRFLQHRGFTIEQITSLF